MRSILIISLLLVTLAFTSAAQEETGMCSEHPTGMQFGQHVAEHARLGELGQDHHPGMHQGFSPCARELDMP